MRHYAATAVLATILAVIAVPAQAQDATDPAAVYENLCATCHGDEMQGGNAQSMVDNIWQFGGTSNYISRSIKHGATHLGMPAYEAVLEDDVIKSLAKYILSKETESGVVKPPPLNRLSVGISS